MRTANLAPVAVLALLAAIAWGDDLWPARHPSAPFAFPAVDDLRAAATPTPAPTPEAAPDPADEVSLPKAAFLMPGRAADNVLRPRFPLADDRGPADTVRGAAAIEIVNTFRDLAVRLVATPTEGDPLVLLLAPGQSERFHLSPGEWTFRRESWRAVEGANPPVVEEFPPQPLLAKRLYEINFDGSREDALRRIVDAPVRE